MTNDERNDELYAERQHDKRVQAALRTPYWERNAQQADLFEEEEEGLSNE